ncbi:STAS domain-containing protein [Georgenia subflava]|uniref:STAS domain-containing protein n=1 Tax=Georgenia subflava TaxID=1622177 RepID=A0A6N7EEU4_9MICO|nr:STAS domain-containing protein [Georgenia subflava]MPV36629.1 STAS domain-containing protein [Georgenia subflava]
MTAHDDGQPAPDGTTAHEVGTDRSNGIGAVSLLTSEVRLRLILSGEVESSLRKELTEAIDDAESTGLPVDVDTRSVTFMDSSVIALLARLAYRRPEQRLRFIDPPDLVRFLLGVTQLGAVVDVLDHDPGFPESSTAYGRPSGL